MITHHIELELESEFKYKISLLGNNLSAFQSSIFRTQYKKASYYSSNWLLKFKVNLILNRWFKLHNEC